MSEFLTVRLNSQACEPIQWLVWSVSQQEVIASGELQSAEQLGELSEYAKQRPAIMLIPSSDVLLKQIDLPAGASRQLSTMLPFLVEDEVAEEVDELHFSVLAKTGNLASFAAVKRDYLVGWIETFKEHGINVKQALPDCLALPLIEASPSSVQQVSAVQIGQQWLFRSGQHQGFMLDHDWLELMDDRSWASVLPKVKPLVISEALEPSDETEQQEAELTQHDVTITSYTPLPEHHAQLSGNWQQGDAELVMAMLTKGALLSKANLLTGEFKATSSWIKHWKVWQKVAVASVLLLTVMVVQNWFEVQRYELQAAQYRAESERIFRDVFPGKRKIPTVSYLKRQMSAEESRLSGGNTQDSLLVWLAQLPQSLHKVESMDVMSVRFDGTRNEIRIQAKAKDFQSFEAVRSELSEHFNVEQGQLNRNGADVFGSYVIRRKS